MKSFIYGHIHPCRWIKMTLSFKFEAQSSKFKLYAHAQTILHIGEVIVQHVVNVFECLTKVRKTKYERLCKDYEV